MKMPLTDQDDEMSRRVRLIGLALLLSCPSAYAQNATLSLVCSMEKAANGSRVRAPKADTLFHLGVSTDDPSLDRCAVFLSTSAPAAGLVIRGVPIVVDAAHASRIPMSVQPNGTHPARKWRFDAELPPNLPRGVPLRIQGVLYSSSDWAHFELTNGIVATTAADGPHEIHHGFGAGAGTLIVFPFDIDRMEALPSIEIQLPIPPANSVSGGVSEPAEVSPDGSTAVILVEGLRSAPGQLDEGRLCVLHDVDTTNPSWFWLPSPGDGYLIDGAPHFAPGSNDVLWVLEKREKKCITSHTTYGNGYRMARYDVSGAAAVALGYVQIQAYTGACELPTYARSWTLDDTGSSFFLLRNQSSWSYGGMDLVRVSATSGAAAFVPVASAGTWVQDAITKIPGSNHAFVQYFRAGLGYQRGLRAVDLGATTVSEEELEFERAVAVSSNGAMAIAPDPTGVLDVFDGAQPFDGPGLPLNVMSQIPSLGSTSFAVLAASGGELVLKNGANASAPLVRVSLGAGGVPVTESVLPRFSDTITTTVYGGERPLYLSLPGRNALMIPQWASQDRHIVLDVTTMTYMSLRPAAPASVEQPTFASFRVGHHLF